MQSLPNELLAQISSYLVDQPPSIMKFNHEPNANLAYSNTEPLKALSEVSWRWRKVVLPILFEFSRIPMDTESQWVPIDARLVDSMQGQLSRLSNHEFTLYTKLRSKFKSTSGSAFEPAMDDVLIQLCRIQDEDEFLKSTPGTVWLPHLSKWFNNFARFVTENKLKRHIKSVVVNTNKKYNSRHVSAAQRALERSASEMWTQIFSCLEPMRVVVTAPPETMAALLGSAMGSSDAWAFEMKMHYIELLQKEPPPVEQAENELPTSDSALIHRRPWHHIGYNEGSSITAYSTYEFHLKSAPEILEFTLHRLSKNPESCRNLTSLTFIAVFPLASTTTSIMRQIHKMPSIKKITFQLAPGPENDLLGNGSKRRKAQSSDFWFEWRLGYMALADMEAFRKSGEDEEGQEGRAEMNEIVSGDCYSKQLALEVAEVVEHYLKRERRKWIRVGVERWVREDVGTVVDGQERLLTSHMEEKG